MDCPEKHKTTHMRIIRHRLNNRISSAAVMLVLCVLLVGLIPLRVAYAADMEVSLPYEQTWSNDSGKTVNNTFTYQLTAADAQSPAPAEASGGAYTFQLSGTEKGSKILHFSFANPGYYHYNITPLTTGLAKEYTYSPPEYNLMIMVINGNSGLEVGAMTLQDKDLAKYPALIYGASYNVPKKTTGPGDGGGGGAAGGGAAPGVAPAGTVIDDPEPPTTITDPEPPKDILPNVDYWALLNLILLVLTILMAVADGILYFRNPTDKYGDEYEEDEDEEVKRHGLPRILAFIAAVAAFILFIFTEDITEPMIWVDEYTIWQLLLFVVTVILSMLSKKEYDDPEEESSQPVT